LVVSEGLFKLLHTRAEVGRVVVGCHTGGLARERPK